MTSWPTFTVAILSHRRPRLLRRVIGAVAQLDYPAFEIVVVGDQPTLDAFGLAPEIARQIRYRSLAEANISKGRNIALTMAAGDIVAFCDDDGAPEPNWLRALAVAFRRSEVAAASGIVLASDGLTMEWQGRMFSSAGREWPANMPSKGIKVADPYSQTTDDRYLGLIGVNSAFRRMAVLQAGGFDEAYVYFLEETDMAIRLARNGWSAALVPEAVVHHLREENATRSATRVPRNLYQVAASKAHFCRRHLNADLVPEEMARYRAARLKELDPYIRLGALRGAGLRKLERQLDRGLKEGAERTTVLPLTPGLAAPELARFHRPGPSPALRIALVTGWGAVSIARIRRLARRLTEAGHMVSCFNYCSGLQPARVTFTDGLWLHRGGTWRPNQRRPDGRLVIARSSRAMVEIERVAGQRNFDVILRPGRLTPEEEGIALQFAGSGLVGPLAALPPGPEADIPPRVRHALMAALDEERPARFQESDARNPRAAVSANASIV